jgi:hypothetical protein
MYLNTDNVDDDEGDEDNCVSRPLTKHIIICHVIFNQ